MESTNKRVAINSVLLYIDLIVSALLWFLASRYLLDALGVHDFGLYNVVGGLVVLLNVLNAAMVTTSYRYIATELGKTEGNPNIIFNACRNIHSIIAILVFCVGLPIGFYYINNYLNVDISRIPDARFVYVISLITCAISTYLIPYVGLITALENFKFKVIVNILRGIIRFLLIVLLLFSAGDRLRIYAVFALIPELLVGISYIIYTRKGYFKIIRFKVYHISGLYKEICKFASWLLVGTIGRISKVQGASLLINYFFGTILNASLAISNTLNSFVSAATSSLAQAAAPQITKSFSSGNSSRSLDITIYISKYAYIMMLLVCVPILMQTDFVLGVWLNTVPEYTSIFVKLILLDTLISCFGAGISTLYEASGRIKPFQITSSAIILLSVVLGYIGYKLGLPPYSLLVIYCLMSCLDRIIACVLLKFILKIEIKRLIKFSYLNSIKLSIIILPFYFLNQLATSAVQSVTMMIATEVALVLIIYFWGLNRKEKEFVCSYVTKIKAKI